MDIFGRIIKKRDKNNNFSILRAEEQIDAAKESEELPDIPGFLSLDAAKKAKSVPKNPDDLPELRSLSSLRSARGKMTDEARLPDLIELAIQREEIKNASRRANKKQSRFNQNKLAQLKVYRMETEYNGEAAVGNRYWGFINNIIERRTNSKKKRFNDISKEYSQLKFQSWTLFIIIIGLIYVLFVYAAETQDYRYTVKTVAALSQAEEILQPLTTVEYDETQDKNVFEKYHIRNINQLDEGLPNGCETVALAMILSQFIENIDPHEIVDKYLPKAELRIYNGVYISEDPTYYYIGDPAGTGFGIFAEGLAKAAENTLKAYRLDQQIEVKNISGCSNSELLGYVSREHPVIVWGTLDMSPVQWGRYTWHLPSGQLYRYPGNLHCYILAEVSDTEVVLYDPREGQVTYNRSLFLGRWNEMGPYENIGRQAIVIQPIEN